MVKHRPMNNIEDVVVFSKGKIKYNPQKTPGKPYTVVRDKRSRIKETSNSPIMRPTVTVNEGFRYPVRTLYFGRNSGLHPTQKPVALMEYLIKTYTDEGDTVLDFTMGSGTTGVAAGNLKRKFIGIEKDNKYFAIAAGRVMGAYA